MFSKRIIFRILLFCPVIWIWLLAYLLSSQRNKMEKDLDHFCEVHLGEVPQRHRIYQFLREMLVFPEFRSLFLHRLGKVKHLMKYLMPKGALSLVFAMPREKIGGGLFIQHGHCSDIGAVEIGENCWINQRVTIGFKGNGCPTIGNNVSIGVGAVVLGDVKIGNNVRIGANAIVVHDVPDNCTVCSPAATIVSRREPGN